MSDTTMPSGAMSFASACARYFGRMPNQNLTEFQKELKALMPEDRAYLIKEFAKIGIEVTPSA